VPDYFDEPLERISDIPASAIRSQNTCRMRRSGY
jgi:hypothetical protein